MLVLKLELWPHGNQSAAREIGRMTIVNVGGSERHGDYAVAIADDTGERWQAEVHGHPRKAKAWWLVAKALYRCGFVLLNPGDLTVSVCTAQGVPPTRRGGP
jgi:hypothetical protein